MRLSIAAVVGCAACAYAFKDASPFLLFSSSPIPEILGNTSTAQLQSQAAVSKAAKAFLNECPSQIYYMISQPSISAQDLRGEDNVPFLKRALTNSGVQAHYSVAEVVFEDNGMADDLVAYVKSHCGGIELDSEEARRFEPKDFSGRAAIIRTNLESLPAIASQRGEKLAKHGEFPPPPAPQLLLDDVVDHYIDSLLLRKLSKHSKYTVIYTTTPLLESVQDEYVYDAGWGEEWHMDLKRDLRARVPVNTMTTDMRPLFEKYQFLTPGIFMGLLTGLFLISILSVGMKAVSSLQVSYAAFEKDMGPAAQKSQQ